MIHINKKVFAILLIVAVLAGAGGIIALADIGLGGSRLVSAEQAARDDYFVEKYSKMETLFQLIKENYYTDVDDEKLLEGAYAGLFSGTGDKYSQYISPEEYESYFGTVTGTFFGVGMTFQAQDDGSMIVISTVKGSPAEKAGIKEGDLIVSVDGKSTKGLTSSEVRDMVRGEKDTEVQVTLSRNGQEYTAKMVRREMPEMTVYSSMVDNSNIGYIEITQFGDNTGNEFKTAMKEIAAEGAEAFILDLRYNGGGIVNSAVSVADELMDAGTVVYAVDKQGNRKNYTTVNGRTDMPFVILVNEYTASASEILAAGVQDNKEGIIVGTKTYGKGIIQETQGYSDGSAVTLTMWEYFSPSGKTIHGVGVVPDYEQDLPLDAVEDVQLLKAIEVLTENQGIYFNVPDGKADN